MELTLEYMTVDDCVSVGGSDPPAVQLVNPASKDGFWQRFVRTVGAANAVFNTDTDRPVVPVHAASVVSPSK